MSPNLRSSGFAYAAFAVPFAIGGAARNPASSGPASMSFSAASCATSSATSLAAAAAVISYSAEMAEAISRELRFCSISDQTRPPTLPML